MNGVLEYYGRWKPAGLDSRVKAPNQHKGRARKGKGTGRASGLSDGVAAVAPVMAHPAILVFSRDNDVVKLAARAADPPWIVQACPDAREARESLSKLAVKMVIIDDAGVDEPTRGWLLETIRKYTTDALIAYIASDHNPESERRARSYPVQYYTSRPLDDDRTLRVLQSFIRARR